MKKQSLSKIFDQAQKLIAVVGGFAVLFVISSRVYYNTYYSNLGVDTRFIEYSNYDFNYSSAISSIFTLVLIVVVLLRYLRFCELQKSKVITVSADVLNKPYEKMKTRGDFEYVSNRGWLKIIKFLGLIYVVILTILIATHCVNSSAVYFFIEYELQLIFAVFCCGLVYICEKTKYHPFDMTLILLAFVIVYTYVLPNMTGYIQAIADVSNNEFITYSIFTSQEHQLKGQLLYYGKNHYFFKIGRKVIVMPDSEVKEMIKE